jgi:hypothetical protein
MFIFVLFKSAKYLIRLMKSNRFLILSIVAGMLFLFSGTANAQFIALARKIKSMNTAESDVATVLLDAKTFKVYTAIVDTLSSEKKFKISNRDDKKRFVEFTARNNKFSMQVDSIADGLTQITVVAPVSEDKETRNSQAAVEAIQRISAMAGVKCTVEKPKSKQ